MGWLRSPYESSKVTPLQQEKAKRTEKTINLTITVIANFYDYLYRNEQVQNDMMEKLMKQVFTGGNSRYKSFLHHVNKDKPSNIYIALFQFTDKREEWEKDKWDVRILHDKYGIDYNKSKHDYFLDFSKIDDKVREQVKKYCKLTK
ncbi:hypothetical protein J6TS1_36420 [Siminovitchia terrae]|uniref:Uncharacterized protein n=1 Tax=Siminovitchia terrae TaxID=1914933 RepID=A0ABQ4L0H4_SIMTE|nr:hypothetical protein J6TS1_36420 [Siminovitchia terrae]